MISAVYCWSCYPDLNRRPHPYQLTKGCCCLSFAILSCCRQSIVPQCFQGFFAAPYSLLSYLKKYCFLMPVSVLCRFLLETATSDLIPTHAILRPIRAAFLCSVRRIHELQRPGHDSEVRHQPWCKTALLGRMWAKRGPRNSPGPLTSYS